VSTFVKAEGPSGRAKIHSDEPKQALGLAQYLRAIGYIEDTNGNEIDEKALKMAIRSRHEDASPS
jgi:benzoyl-CoA reductase/2-hydroxyglutaryl-CoA dehydratase subunit BcrC/BadD/HgdB